MHVLWVHVSVNFGNRYLDGLFAIFHYACEHRGSFPCEARERELLNDYERSACEWEEGVLGYFFILRDSGNLIIVEEGGRNYERDN